MDWLLVAVIVAIVGQFVLIKWLLARHDQRLRQSQLQAKTAKAQLIESAADAQLLTARRLADATHGGEHRSQSEL